MKILDRRLFFCVEICICFSISFADSFVPFSPATQMPSRVLLELNQNCRLLQISVTEELSDKFLRQISRSFGLNQIANDLERIYPAAAGSVSAKRCQSTKPVHDFGVSSRDTFKRSGKELQNKKVRCSATGNACFFVLLVSEILSLKDNPA